MLTLEQLKILLAQNEALLQHEVDLGQKGSFQRLTELMLHRTLLKDMVIDELEAQLNGRAVKAA